MYQIMRVYQNSGFKGVFIKIENTLIDTRTYYYDFKDLYSMKYIQCNREYLINTLYERDCKNLHLYEFVEKNLLDFVESSLNYELDKFEKDWFNVATTSSNIKDKKNAYMFVKSSTFLFDKVTKGLKGAKNEL